MSDEVHPRDWVRVQAMLDELLELEGDERTARLEALCAGDEELRRRVRRLLAADASPESPLDRPLGDWALGGPSAGRRVGPWRLLEVVGIGGMGVVHRAERVDGSHAQQVAVKLLDRRDPTGERGRRFEKERRILASLEHPGIARLIDGGVTEDGISWIAMEFVDGETLTASCEREQASLERRLKLVEETCRAVAHAHQHLVVHRDLKPSNILVSTEGRVKLVDFGIAKLLDEETGEATLTLDGARRLTPRYAAPEQLRGEEITTATDVYALGVVLYELLSDHPPFGERDSSARQIEDEVLTQEPHPLPSRIPRDLSRIVHKALRKEPSARYPSASALGDDLARFLRHEPVTAVPPSVGYRIGRFVRRHRGGVIASSVVLLSLVAGLMGTAWQARRAARSAAQAEQVRDFLVAVFEEGYASESLGEALTAREVLDAGMEKLQGGLRQDPQLRSELLRVLGSLYFSLGEFSRSDSLLTEALAEAKLGFGSNSAQVGEAIDVLTRTLIETGELDRADSLLAQAISIYEGKGERYRGALARVFTNQGVIASRRDDDETAGRMHAKALAIDLELLGPDDPDLATDLNNLGVALDALGDYDRADSLHRAALAIRRNSLGPDHPEVAWSLQNLASVAEHVGNHALSDSCYEAAISMLRGRFPDGHPDIASLQVSYAESQRRRGDLAQADSLLGLAVEELSRPRLGPSYELARALNAWGTNAYYRGDLPTAAERLGRATQVWNDTYGPENANTLTTRNNRAVILHRLGRLEEARGEFEAIYEIRRRILSSDHPQVAYSLKSLGLLAVDQGRWEEAETRLKAAETVLAQQGPQYEVALAETRSGLGRCYLARGELDRAESLLLGAMESCRRLLAEDHPVTIQTRQALHDLYLREGDATHAAEYAAGSP